MEFPAPLEVDRELYQYRFLLLAIKYLNFPAPREVDRELYNIISQNLHGL